jgi:hypothetical protein
MVDSTMKNVNSPSFLVADFNFNKKIRLRNNIISNITAHYVEDFTISIFGCNDVAIKNTTFSDIKSVIVAFDISQARIIDGLMKN